MNDDRRNAILTSFQPLFIFISTSQSPMSTLVEIFAIVLMHIVNMVFQREPLCFYQFSLLWKQHTKISAWLYSFASAQLSHSPSP